jgi:8-oxo-dGTP diphosphatase
MQPLATDFCPRCGTRNQPTPQDGQIRPVCPACGYVTYVNPKTAAISFITHEDRLLLVQRRYEPGAGKWGLPGGFVENGEHPAQTARREAAEETGLEIEIAGLLDVFYVENGVITIAYAGRYLGGTPSAADDVQDARWYTRDNLPELVFLSTVTLCRRWVNGEIG